MKSDLAEVIQTCLRVRALLERFDRQKGRPGKTQISEGQSSRLFEGCNKALEEDSWALNAVSHVSEAIRQCSSYRKCADVGTYFRLDRIASSSSAPRTFRTNIVTARGSLDVAPST